MKAIVYRTYGSPDVLALEEVSKPEVGTDDVLVRVHAASINSWDWDNLTGASILSRLLSGLFKPKRAILGADIAGRVEAVGSNVTRFKPGDDVFGDLCATGWGGLAEYVCAPETALAPKSPSMTFEQAASVPQAAVMALQGVRDYGKVQPGQRVLINGAGGGVGTFAVQMAKSLGAEVTGVDSAEKLDLMRSAGAAHVVDYAREDFTRSERRYDLILDVIGRRSMFDYKRALSPDGRYLMIGGSTARMFQLLLVWAWLSITRSKQNMGLLAHEPNRNLADLTELIETGQLVPVIHGRYTLSDAPEALRQLGDGRVLGKAVITVVDIPLSSQ